MNSLREIRLRKSLTLAQLSGKASISQRTLIEYESGLREIPPLHLKLLAKLLTVTSDELSRPSKENLQPTPAPAPSTPISAPTPPTVLVAPTSGFDPEDDKPAPAASETPAWPTADRPTPPAAQSASAPQESRPAFRPPPPRPGTAYSGAGTGYSGVRPPFPGRPTEAPRGTVAPRNPLAPQHDAKRSAPGPASEGQLLALRTLAKEMKVSESELLARTGKPFTELNRIEIRRVIGELWVKAMSSGIRPRTTPALTPSRSVRERPDFEVEYLTKLRETKAVVEFHLFDGQAFFGRIIGFTPYQITIREVTAESLATDGRDLIDSSGDTGRDITLRKLAIAYWRVERASDELVSDPSLTAPREISLEDDDDGEENERDSTDKDGGAP